VEAAQRLRREPTIELAHDPELSLFAFRDAKPGLSTADQNARNRDLLARINAPRRIMITGTEIGGVYWLRLCILHLRTSAERVREGVDIILRCLNS
jgi:aromatic-L-amino-acid decarboxylase